MGAEDSQPALLALVERMGDEIEQVVLPIVHDPVPGALQMSIFRKDDWVYGCISSGISHTLAAR